MNMREGCGRKVEIAQTFTAYKTAATKPIGKRIIIKVRLSL